MPVHKSNKISNIEMQQNAIKKLQVEIAKGWSGPVSKRNVKEIVATKLKGYKQ